MGSEDREQQRFARALIEIGGVLHGEETVDRILELVTELTRRTVRSGCAVSVTLVERKEPFTPTATGTVARALDEVQYETGNGPCLEALAEGRTINASLSECRGHWPAFVDAAEAAGIGSVLSVPLLAPDRALGALNVYSRDDQRFEETEETTASLLAQQAGTVLANAVAFVDATTLNVQLLEALVTRDLIGQAKGILMARQNCHANDAFDILRRASQRTNRKLRDVAAELVAGTTGGDAP